MARPTRKLQDIERAAVRLFADRGVGRVTTKEIALEAGCSEGALYRHYPGMDELAWRLFKREVEKFSFELSKILHSDEDYAGRIRSSVAMFYEFFDRDPTTFKFILLSEHQFAANRRVDPKLSPEKLVLSFVKQGIQDGVFGISDAGLGASMVLGLVLMPATHLAIGMLKGPMKRYISGTTQACLEVLQSTQEFQRSEKKDVRKRRGFEQP